MDQGLGDTYLLLPIFNIRTIFGHIPTWDKDLPSFSDMGQTRTDFFLNWHH